MLRPSIIVLVDGNVSATDGRLWYQLGKLHKSENVVVKEKHQTQTNKCVLSAYLLRFIHDFAVLLKLSGLGVVIASKSTSCNNRMKTTSFQRSKMYPLV